MMTNQNPILKVGEWVKGESRDGELILGYVEAVNTLKGILKVRVITSDHQEITGTSISLLNKQVKRLPNSQVINKEQIQFLIDLALSTGDEEWFLELSSKLNSIRELVNNGI